MELPTSRKGGQLSHSKPVLARVTQRALTNNEDRA